MSTLVNLLLAIVLNLLGVQVQEHVQESQSTDLKPIEVSVEEKTNKCIEEDTLYISEDQMAL